MAPLTCFSFFFLFNNANLLWCYNKNVKRGWHGMRSLRISGAVEISASTNGARESGRGARARTPCFSGSWASTPLLTVLAIKKVNEVQVRAQGPGQQKRRWAGVRRQRQLSSSHLMSSHLITDLLHPMMIGGTTGLVMKLETSLGQ